MPPDYKFLFLIISLTLGATLFEERLAEKEPDSLEFCSPGECRGEMNEQKKLKGDTHENYF